MIRKLVACIATEGQLEVICREQGVKCDELGINKHNLCDYEVEYLCDYKKKVITDGKKQTIQVGLKVWLINMSFIKAKMNPGGQLRKLLRLVLQVSFHLVHQTYINDYKVGDGIMLNEVSVGCECTDCLGNPVEGCCAGASQHKFAYNELGQVRIRPGLPIYECNKRCHCGIDCPNRVVQRGIQYSLCIFRTDNGRGWGVKTMERIRKNTFVMEYVGEIITTEEADCRGHIYDKEGATYLFDLDYVDDEYTVDAAHYGNISHFVNHSCDPNLQVYNVFIDNLDERLPRIAFFATCGIKAGEELTFDYKMKIDPVDAESTKMDSNFSLTGLPGSPKKRMHVECKCEVPTCRKYLF
uniref:Histone-lysine N-methyltransferase n=1 Tax=Sinocyclocheilus rhinocerous TaxID=307959 RepID=A0A673HMG6_9TELE